MVQAARQNYPDNKVHGANMGPTWVLSAPDGPHVGPTNLVIREQLQVLQLVIFHTPQIYVVRKHLSYHRLGKIVLTCVIFTNAEVHFCFCICTLNDQLKLW